MDVAGTDHALLKPVRVVAADFINLVDVYHSVVGVVGGVCGDLGIEKIGYISWRLNRVQPTLTGDGINKIVFPRGFAFGQIQRPSDDVFDFDVLRFVAFVVEFLDDVAYVSSDVAGSGVPGDVGCVEGQVWGNLERSNVLG